MNILPSSSQPLKPQEPKGKDKAASSKQKQMPSRVKQIIGESRESYKKESLQAEVSHEEPLVEEIPSLSWLSGNLKEKKQRKDLETIRQKQTESSAKVQTSSSRPLFSAEPLGKSANPVGTFQTPVYFSKSFVSSECHPTFPMFSNILRDASEKVQGTQGKKEAGRNKLYAFNKTLYGIYSKQDLSEGDKLRKTIEAFQAFKKDNYTEGDSHRYSFNKVIDLVEREFAAILPVKEERIQQLPVLYSRDEIISKLRIRLTPKVPLEPKEGETIPEEDLTIPEELSQHLISQIQKLNAKEPFITKEALTQDFPELGIKPSSLTEFVSSYDLETHLGNTSLVKAMIANARKGEYSAEYVVKLGNENKRELLARKLLVLLGFEEFYHLKTEIQLPNATIKGYQATDAIASTIIESENMDEWNSAWDNYQKAELRLQKAISNEDKQNIEEYQKVRDVHAEKLKHFGGSQSIPTFVLMSAVLGGYDEHLGQFVFGNKEFSDIDFSRLLPPSPYLQKKKGDQVNTNFIFRNAFLNHPACQEPLPEDIISRIDSWDIPSIEKQINEMAGNPERMQESYRKLQELEQAIGIIEESKLALTEKEKESSQEQLQPLYSKYKVLPSDPQPLETLRRRVFRERNSIRQANFEYVHFQASKDALQRMKAAQEYVRSADKPTAYEAFSKMYPEVMPFFHYLAHSTKEPGDAISMKVERGETKPKSLEEIKNQAAKELKGRYAFDDEDEEISETELARRKIADAKLQAEIDAMQQSLDSIKEKGLARSRDELGLTMDLT